MNLQISKTENMKFLNRVILSIVITADLNTDT